jgi:2'-5' RNA ligase
MCGLRELIGEVRKGYSDLADIFPGPEFIADSFTLMQSELLPSGAVYTCIARFPYGVAAD